MKKLLTAALSIVFVVVFFQTRSHAQTSRSAEENVAIVLYNRSTGADYIFYAKMEKIIITPSGNFLRTVSLKIDKNEPIMDFAGPIKIYEVKMYYDIDGNGTEEKIIDTMAVLNRSGNLKFVYHYNGAGYWLPRGW